MAVPFLKQALPAIAGGLILSVITTMPAEAAGTGYVFVSNERDNIVQVFDPANDFEHITDISTSRRPRDMQFNADHTLLYVACGQDDIIDVIDVATLEVIDGIPT